mmetsp:Transcript_100329/g.198978  ORF Transcript_100329/g.198978 Transcript_100329/m.198978 type:complete len:328 (-) Transcript_100329:63-1046(-)
MPPVSLENHGKAVIVKGDTRPIKDFLKAKGGKWNQGLGGWIYPGSKKSQILSDLQAHGVEVENKTEGCVAEASQAAEKRKRTEPANTEEPAEETVALKESTKEGFIQVTDIIRASISSFRGDAGIDVRKFWKAGDGQMNPTAKGIRFKKAELDELCRVAKDIDKACGLEDDSQLKLGDDVIASVKEPDGGGPKCIDIRKYYQDKSDGGTQKPTKKGIWLSQKDWSSLKAVFGELTALYDSGAAREIPSKPTEVKKAKKPKLESGLSSDTLKQHVTELLVGRDLQAVSLKSLRDELETQLKVPAGGLEARKEEIKGMVTDLLRKGKGH